MTHVAIVIICQYWLTARKLLSATDANQIMALLNFLNITQNNKLIKFNREILHSALQYAYLNKKFELMLMRRAKAYCSSGSVV